MSLALLITLTFNKRQVGDVLKKQERKIPSDDAAL